MFKIFFAPLNVDFYREVLIFENTELESSISFALSFHRASNIPHDVRLVGPDVQITFTLPVPSQTPKK